MGNQSNCNLNTSPVGRLASPFVTRIYEPQRTSARPVNGVEFNTFIHVLFPKIITTPALSKCADLARATACALDIYLNPVGEHKTPPIAPTSVVQPIRETTPQAKGANLQFLLRELAQSTGIGKTELVQTILELRQKEFNKKQEALKELLT